MTTGCFLSTGRSLDDALAGVLLAEELDYESVLRLPHHGRESLTVLTGYALATQHIRLGTAVVPIYTRTPATMAPTAATIDELSGGRLDLGLTTSVTSWCHACARAASAPVRRSRASISSPPCPAR